MSKNGKESLILNAIGTNFYQTIVNLDFLQYNIEGYFLPPYKATTLRFIKDFLRGKKLLIKAAEVYHFNVPSFQELAVKSVFE